MTTTIIFPNGHGGFVEAQEAIRLGYDFNGCNLFSGGYCYSPLEVTERKPEDMLGSAGDAATLYRTETGRVY
jgi:hypothetical protein